MKGGCEEVCVNTKGSYFCQCHSGEIIQGDVSKCNGKLNNLEIPLNVSDLFKTNVNICNFPL